MVLSIDFCEVAGHHVLVVTDDYSTFPDVEIVHSTSAKAVLPKLVCHLWCASSCQV